MGRKPRRPQGLVARVGEAAAARGLLEGPLAVAVSGGVDSMVLMHVLVALGRAPVVLSLDHGIRPESKSELRFVGEAAAALGLPFVGGALGVSPGADLSARAREARYGWLDAWLAANPGACVALAQHRDDQSETLLDRLMRGAGAGGLAGMGWRRGRYVRPLLAEPRSVLEAWARARGIRWVEDPSNTKGTRGRLRSEVLPMLERLRPGAGAAIARSAGLLAEDELLLRDMAAALRAADGVDVQRWRGAPGPLRRRALLSLVAETQVSGARGALTAARIDAALGLRGRGAVALDGGWRLVVSDARIRCLPPPPERAAIAVGAWGIWQVAASAPVSLRAPAPGDVMGGVSLRERLRAAGVPAALRRYHPVVRLGARVWVPGVWSDRGKTTCGTRVVVSRVASASWPGGGPYIQEL